MKGELLMKLAGIQISCSEDKGKNLEKAIRLAHIASEKGAQIICFQELFTTHWFPKEMNKSHFSLAEKIDGPSMRRMQKLAEENEVVLICPIFEKEGESSFYNSAVVIDAGGEILGRYRKIHIPQIPLWEEKYYFSS
jgi:N-carbamoylputrescine amidase